MSTAVTTPNPTTQQPLTVKTLFSKEDVKAKFQEIIGKNPAPFISSVISVVNGNEALRNADPTSIYMAAIMAATLNLQVHPAFGQAYIIPYDGKAQFQIGAKGFKQLALRSGQFKTISDAIVYKGQMISADPLKGYVFDWGKKENPEEVIGYVSYFKLLNGYEGFLYMTKAQCEAHGRKYSRSYEKGWSQWQTNPDAMCLKTVTKLNLSKNAPLSIEMEKAIISDQAVINDADTLDIDYTDQGKAEITKEGLSSLYAEKKIKMKISDQRNAERIINENETESFAKLKTQLEEIQ